MGQKSFLYFPLSAVILCIYYMIVASALPGMEKSPPDSNFHPNISSLSAGPPGVAKINYVVWPDDPGNISMTSSIERIMATIVSRDSITPFTSPRTGIEFWVVTANDLQARFISRIRYVSVRRVHGDEVSTADLNMRPQWLKTSTLPTTTCLTVLL